MSIGQELRPPTWPAACPLSVRALSRSGRFGTKVAVSARPTMVAVWSRWTSRKRPSNCHSNPLPRSTDQASSRLTFFMRSRMASGTFGRPSANRSPVHSDVRATTSSRVGVMLWAAPSAGATSAAPSSDDVDALHGSLPPAMQARFYGYGRYSARPIFESAMDLPEGRVPRAAG